MHDSNSIRIRIFIPVLMALFATACAGEFDVTTDTDRATTDSVDPESTPVTVDENGEVIDPTAQPLPPAFELGRENPQLLPFHVRMNKLARVTGTTVDDPIFDDLNRNRYALGDHNYGQGIGADLSWNSAKMSTWVDALRPVCDSEAMQTQYPALPEHINEFMLAAYGREANEGDLQLIEDTLSEVGTTSPEERHRTVCLATLSTVEFVGR